MGAGDLPISDLWPTVERFLARHPGCRVYLKWTCPGCGERVTSDLANAYELSGYEHTTRLDGSRCGAWYSGTEFGCAVMLDSPEAFKDWKRA